MSTFDLEGLIRSQGESGAPYLEFLRRDSMSVGLYALSAGALDEQQPHAEDEVYVVLEGEGRFTAADQTRGVRAGDVIFVSAEVPHRFHDITTELKLIVVFAPPDGSRSEGERVEELSA